MNIKGSEFCNFLVERGSDLGTKLFDENMFSLSKLGPMGEGEARIWWSQYGHGEGPKYIVKDGEDYFAFY